MHAGAFTNEQASICRDRAVHGAGNHVAGKHAFGPVTRHAATPDRIPRVSVTMLVYLAPHLVQTLSAYV